MHLLDSNAWIAFLRRPKSPVVGRIQAKQTSEICTCSIVVAELLYGCLRSAKPAANRAKIDALLAPYSCLSFDRQCADQYSVLRRHLEALGTPIGPFDLQIAAIALVNGCTLVTHNTAEFSRVQGLTIEDWEQP